MRKVAIFSVLLLAGLVGSQLLPALPEGALPAVAETISTLTMIGLAFIMIHVGLEFDIDRSNIRQYGWDYVVAMTAAAFPWLLVSGYFIFVMLPSGLWGDSQAWKEMLLTGRFAAPTSAGVLFSMLAAAGLAATWVYRKARVLAIFDDLDTILLMIPLKALLVGLVWQLSLIALLMFALLYVAWRWLHAVRLPVRWPWVLAYASIIAVVSEIIYYASKALDHTVPVHLEVLLPAFVLGCIIQPDHGRSPAHSPSEQRASTIISGAFMLLVGLTMPAIFVPAAEVGPAAAAVVSASQPTPSWDVIALHVLMVTVLSNIGKLFPAFCYRREATWRERVAVAVGMWPRGEVGAGVLVVSLSYGLGGPVLTVAMLSLALNLALTGVFIAVVRALLRPQHPPARVHGADAWTAG